LNRQKVRPTRNPQQRSVLVKNQICDGNKPKYPEHGLQILFHFWYLGKNRRNPITKDKVNTPVYNSNEENSRPSPLCICLCLITPQFTDLGRNPSPGHLAHARTHIINKNAQRLNTNPAGLEIIVLKLAEQKGIGFPGSVRQPNVEKQFEELAPVTPKPTCHFCPIPSENFFLCRGLLSEINNEDLKVHGFSEHCNNCEPVNPKSAFPDQPIGQKWVAYCKAQIQP
jgi:hypothetical protein